MARRIALAALAGAASLAAGAFSEATHAEGPAPDAARVELGRRLFFDPAIGRDGRIACASCHDPEHGFSDARPFSQDERRVLPRHSQPLVDLAGSGFHWDGEFDTVRDVIDARVLPGALAALASAERGLRRLDAVTSAGAHAPDAEAVRALHDELDSGVPYGIGERTDTSVTASIAGRISLRGRYDAGFVAAFGDDSVTSQRIGDALEAYVGSLRSSESAVDRYLAGDSAALGESAQRGLALFRGKAGCVQCHATDGGRAAFTDGKFHNTGVETRRGADASARGQCAPDDQGRLRATFSGYDRAAYKTPSLRDVARRAPYFHDASAADLTEVVRYYVKGGTANDHLDSLLHPLDMTDADVADVVAFLEALTGDERAGLGPVGELRAAEITVRVENIDGSPAPGVSVVVTPFGDRLAGTSAMPRAATVTTDADGRVAVAMPLTTHVVVTTENGGATGPLPDWTETATIVVVPKDRVVARVRFRDGDDDRPDQFRVFPGDMFVPGSPIVFRKVRDVGPSEALYVRDGGRKPAGPADCVVCLPHAAGGAAYPLDFSPAASNVIDLRAPKAEADATTLAALRADVEKIAKFTPRDVRRK
jgi:cytochrome c peroxidase